MSDAAAVDWRHEIHPLLRAAGIRQVAYVPDAGHIRLIEACHADPSMRAIVLTNEAEGMGVLAGAWLGGQRGVMLMQSSGVGNCVNALSLTQICRFPFLALVTMRGEWGEFNGWQVPMGQNTEAAFKGAGVIVQRCDHPEDVAPTIDAALALAFDGEVAVAVLLSQRLIGRKRF
ncbi:MAG: phosphonopyruvate decarboxylase [Alphaproteobacteria bacterium]|nr:phosphonopyruvate decarboxylase [Alphaproteobacteria bacterium]